MKTSVTLRTHKKLIMKMKPFLLFTCILAFFTVSNLNAQPGKPRQSPKTTATGKIGDATITITYGSPSVKGRKIWGDIVPFGKVWRAGANEATILETDKEIKVGGKKLAPGKYSLYAIPDEKEWEIIINSQTGQWGIERSGETTRKVENDVVIVKTKSKQSSTLQETLLYEVTKKGIVMKWEYVEVPVSIK
jgi:hypothetical protein